MYIQTQPQHDQPERASHQPASPWARRALSFLQTCAHAGTGTVTLGDLGPIFASAPRGELALTVDALCALDCLVPQEDGSFHIGPAMLELAPRASRPASTAGHLQARYAFRHAEPGAGHRVSAG